MQKGCYQEINEKQKEKNKQKSIELAFPLTL
jgi:hypothetical protein